MVEVSGLHVLAALPSWENAGTHWIEDWVCPREGQDLPEKRKSLVPTGIQTPDRPISTLVAIPTVIRNRTEMLPTQS